MSKYLLKVSGSNQIVNVVDWDGIGSLIAPSGYEFEPFVTESVDFINYFEEYTEETIEKLYGELEGKFTGELTGSITINGKTFQQIINETPFGEMRITDNFNINSVSSSNSFFVSGSTISLPKYNNTSETYELFFDNIIRNDVKNYKITFNKTSNPNEKISYIISDTEIINDDGFEYIKLSVNNISGSYLVTTQSILNPSTPNDFFYRDEHSSHENYYVDFSLPTDLQVGTFYGDFRGNVVHVNTRIERKIYTTSGEYDVPEWAKEITVIAIGAGGGGGGGTAVTYAPYGNYDALGNNAANIPTLRPIIVKNESVDYGAVIGGGGGAGGNVRVVKFKDRQIFGKCYVTVGKGGSGGVGSHHFNPSKWLEDNPGAYEAVNIFITSMVEKDLVNKFRRRYVYYVDSNGREAYSPQYIVTRAGSFGLIGGKSTFICPQTVRTWGPRGTEVPQVEAWGGIGGVGGMAIPNMVVQSTDPEMIIRGFGIPSIPLTTAVTDPNTLYGENFYQQRVSGGTTLPQFEEGNTTYPELEVLINNNGGSGGMGISMPQWFTDLLITNAQNVPNYGFTDNTYFETNFTIPPGFSQWVTYYSKLFSSLVTDYNIIQYGFFKDSEIFASEGPAPAGGGGGNGQIKGLMLSIDPNIYYTWPFQNIKVGTGGISQYPYLYEDEDMPLGNGGDGGNSTNIPVRDLIASLPNNGGLYGGGGGGGASFYTDLNDLDINYATIGQQGGDGADGIVIVIAEG